MRLALPIPATWKQRAADERVVVDVEPGLSLEVSPITSLPEDVHAWASTLATSDGAEPILTREATSETGWPLVIHESRASAEHRIHVIYVLDEHCALVVIRARDPERLSTRRAELLAIACDGSPEWGVPVGASLDDLLET